MNFPSFSRNLIDENEDCKVDYIVEKADSRSIRILLSLKTDLVNIGNL